MKPRLLSLFSLLCLLALAACAGLTPAPAPPSKPTAPPAAEAATEVMTTLPAVTAPAEGPSPTDPNTEPATEPTTDAPTEELDLTAFLTELALWEEPGRAYTFVRDDIGLRIPAAPYIAGNLLECLVGMELEPFVEGQAALPLPHPFSLLVETNGTVDAIALTAGKITINGVDYSPAAPALLADFLVNEHERFLTGDPFQLQTEMPFTDDDIAEIRLKELENYSGGETEVVTRNRADISRIARGLNQVVARRVETGEEPGMYVGGNAYSCALTLADGTVWSMDYTGNATVKTAAGSEDLIVLALGQEAVFGLLEKNESLPLPTTAIPAGATGRVAHPVVYETGFVTPDASKTRSNLIPLNMSYDTGDVIMPDGGEHLCSLEWPGGMLPASVTATVYPEPEGFWAEPTGGQALEVFDKSEMMLPGGEGQRFVVVKAEFAGGITTEHVFAYRVSMFPAFFYDIDFGNNEGNVLLMRNDVAVGVTGSQNRKYVDFVLGLGLVPSDGEPQKLPAIRKPFSMVFTSPGITFEVRFSAGEGAVVSYYDADHGSILDERRFTVTNPEAIETLYEVDLTDLNTFDRINTDMRGFFTKDAAYFADAFPFVPDQIAGFTVIREEPEQRISYDCDDMPLDIIGEILGYVVMGKDWRAEDPYVPRRFFYSYELTLKDGTVYTIDERVYKNGEDTGWYTIQSNALVSEAFTDGLEGTAEPREKPIRGGISVYDDGTFAFD